MEDTLFLQSEVKDPYALYSVRLSEHPVYWDQKNALWAMYAYASCHRLLNHPMAEIPNPNIPATGTTNAYVATLVESLVRWNNPPVHAVARQAARQLFERVQSVRVEALLGDLMGQCAKSEAMDWVDTVGKKLPVMVVLKGLGFGKLAAAYVLSRVESLCTLMLPNKTEMQVSTLNTVAKDVYQLAENHIINTDFLYANINNANGSADKEKILALHVSNLLGLLIQSYDAGRGILSNALLPLLRRRNHPSAWHQKKRYLAQSVTETLRFDSPIHNTGRVLTEDMIVDETELSKGQRVLLVLASANRDSRQFTHPHRYDVTRSNNGDLLTFGAGIHQCLAKHFSIELAISALGWLFENYPLVRLLEAEIDHEPMINARLPRQILLSLS